MPRSSVSPVARDYLSGRDRQGAEAGLQRLLAQAPGSVPESPVARDYLSGRDRQEVKDGLERPHAQAPGSVPESPGA